MSPSTVYAKSEGMRFNGDSNLTVVSCATCHVTYAIPTSFQKSAVAYPGDAPNGWKIHCPFGHAWWYVGESVQDKLDAQKRRTERERQRADAERDLREHTEHRLRAQKGATTKARKRHAAGVCPCCQRTFQQLQRHMASKHPDFNPAAGA